MSWKSVTLSRYRNMQSRKVVIQLGGLPFTLDQFREHCEKFFGEPDGVVLCRYCRKPVYLSICAVDHAYPLSQGGSIGLENLEFPCAECNDIKGGMTVESFLKYIAFRETLPWDDRKDMDSRLQKAVKLAAGKRWGLKKAAKV